MAETGAIDDSNEYEILPHDEIERLRKEIESIKKNPFGDTDAAGSLLGSIEELNRNLESFLRILSEARKDIIEEYEKSNPVKRLDQLADQNEKIAKALLAVAEMAHDIRNDVELLKKTPRHIPPAPMPRPGLQKPIGMPSQRPGITPQSRVAPQFSPPIQQPQPFIPSQSSQMRPFQAQPQQAQQQQFTQQKPIGPMPAQPQQQQQTLATGNKIPADDLFDLPPLDDLPPFDLSEFQDSKKGKK